MKTPRPIVAAAVALALLGVASACSSEDKGAASDASNPAVETTVTTAATTTTLKDTYAIGQMGKTADLEVTVYAVTFPWESSNQFSKPTPGTSLLLVDMGVVNKAAEQKAISSVVSMEVTDPTGRKMQYAIPLGAGSPIDGLVPAGEPRRGFAAWTIPDGTVGPLKLRVRGDAFTSTGAVFVLTAA